MAARTSATSGGRITPQRLRIFCDADVLIAGSASTTGASHLLLRLSELTLIECLTSRYALTEVERNLRTKLPAAEPLFRRIVAAAVAVVPNASGNALRDLVGQAHVKDVAILATAIEANADVLATFNIRHFKPRTAPPLIRRPREVLSQIRLALSKLSQD